MLGTLASVILSTFLIISPLPVGKSVLAQEPLSLTNRHPDSWVNEVFSDNIILTLHYLKGDVKTREIIDWKSLREPFEVSFSLNPGETFAFQSDILPELEGRVVKTTGATFNWQQGFRSSGWLVGDGVCHLASLINWVAHEAGLEVISPVNHNFAPIPDVPKEFGTSIFYLPGNRDGNVRQNLYITNNLPEEVTFKFAVTPEKVTLTISK